MTNTSDIVNSFLEEVSQKVKGNTFLHSYKNVARLYIIPLFLNHKADKITDITMKNLEAHLDEMNEKFCFDTVKKHRNFIRKMFSFALKKGYITKEQNVSADLELPLKNPANVPDEKSPYSEEQLAKILSFAKKHRFGVEIRILAETGIRRSEFLGLRVRDIDIKNAEIKIRQTVTNCPGTDGREVPTIGGTKTEKSQRNLPISRNLSDKLLEYISSKLPEQRTADSLIFVDKSGNMHEPRNWYRYHYKKFMREMQVFYRKQGIEIPVLPPHHLRHTVASISLNTGMELSKVVKLMGHSSPRMLIERYYHVKADDLRHGWTVLLEKTTPVQKAVTESFLSDFGNEFQKLSAEKQAAIFGIAAGIMANNYLLPEPVSALRG